MTTAGIILYIILALGLGPLWPLEGISGKGGPIGILLVLGWVYLITNGFAF